VIAKATIEGVTFECVICGSAFNPHIYHPEQKTCCKKCKRKLDQQRKNENGYKKRYRKFRNEIVGSKESETIDRIAIFERDGWICQVCKKKVRQDLKYPHPMSASLDHIKPLALGGSHTRTNVQLAHLRCNFKKGDVGGGQLRLL
jgi:5-methylcytosine-specific restriction endonuclease McrA